MPTHAEKRIMPYSAEQMFDLIADVPPLPRVPALGRRRPHPQPRAAARRRGRGDRGRPGGLVQGVPRALRQPRHPAPRGARAIDVEYLEGPFKYLRNHWKFDPRGASHCEVDFFVDFEFRSAILQRLIGLVFNEAMQRIVRAFERRAEALYGVRFKA